MDREHPYRLSIHMAGIKTPLTFITPDIKIIRSIWNAAWELPLTFVACVDEYVADFWPQRAREQATRPDSSAVNYVENIFTYLMRTTPEDAFEVIFDAYSAFTSSTPAAV